MMQVHSGTEHILVDHVRKTFQTTAGAQLIALADVNISIRSGEFLSIVGPSGCGKSTLLYIVAGLLAPSNGRVMIDGKRKTKPSSDVGVVLQNSSIFPWRRVSDNVGYGPEMRGMSRSERRELVQHYLELVGLADFADYYPHELSGGMKQRVAIAQMLACSPSVFLMDEPFGALDALTRELLQEQLLNLWERDRRTVLFITHGIDEAVLLSDRIIVMSGRPGRVKHVYDIDLPRPRPAAEIRSLPEFSRLRTEIWSSIRQDGLDAL